MWLIIILKVTKNQGFTLSLEDTFFKKPQGEGNQIDPHSTSAPPSVVLRLIIKKAISIRSFPKTIRSLRIAKPYFTLCRAYLSEVIWKKQQMRTNIQTNKLFMHQTMCVSNVMCWEEKHIRCVGSFIKRCFFVDLLRSAHLQAHT